ncbi:MAG: (d)CMP kinase [bacterium]|nr:MAG: (d)CMP kinase [bacterium]
MKQIVAIDGPSGAGKSTLARELAKRLGYQHLDTGAMYRAVAVAARRAGVGLDDSRGLNRLCKNIEIRFEHSSGGNRVLLNGEDVSRIIRTPEMSSASSAVSAVSEVRLHMVRLQRKLGRGGGVVAEGRDIGTVVFPDTRAKFYLDASVEERARRRWLELKKKGMAEPFDRVLADIEKRDRDDSTRVDSPLRRAEDAIYVDSTSMGPEEVLNLICRVVKDLEGGDENN